MKPLQVCSPHCYPDEEKTTEATKQSLWTMGKGMNPSAREARRISPANAGNSFFVEPS